MLTIWCEIWNMAGVRCIWVWQGWQDVIRIITTWNTTFNYGLLQQLHTSNLDTSLHCQLWADYVLCKYIFKIFISNIINILRQYHIKPATTLHAIKIKNVWQKMLADRIVRHLFWPFKRWLTFKTSKHHCSGLLCNCLAGYFLRAWKESCLEKGIA